jgi:hypothetical protein
MASKEDSRNVRRKLDKTMLDYYPMLPAPPRTTVATETAPIRYLHVQLNGFAATFETRILPLLVLQDIRALRATSKDILEIVDAYAYLHRVIALQDPLRNYRMQTFSTWRVCFWTVSCMYLDSTIRETDQSTAMNHIITAMMPREKGMQVLWKYVRRQGLKWVHILVQQLFAKNMVEDIRDMPSDITLASLPQTVIAQCTMDALSHEYSSSAMTLLWPYISKDLLSDRPYLAARAINKGNTAVFLQMSALFKNSSQRNFFNRCEYLCLIVSCNGLYEDECIRMIDECRESGLFRRRSCMHRTAVISAIKRGKHRLLGYLLDIEFDDLPVSINKYEWWKSPETINEIIFSARTETIRVLFDRNMPDHALRSYKILHLREETIASLYKRFPEKDRIPACLVDFLAQMFSHVGIEPVRLFIASYMPKFKEHHRCTKKCTLKHAD